MRISSMAAAAVLVIPVASAIAQNATVQQPAFSNFSVGTTVSVPDRGGALLGGLSRAGSSRKSFGPLRTGSSFGLFRDHAGVSTHVTIHDLREMDRLLLGQDQLGSRNRMTSASNANRAWSLLRERHAGRDDSARSRPTTAASTASKAASPADRGDRSFQLGRQAEAKGKTAVARLHYRMAARHGSRRARARLDSLGSRRTAMSR